MPTTQQVKDKRRAQADFKRLQSRIDENVRKAARQLQFLAVLDVDVTGFEQELDIIEAMELELASLPDSPAALELQNQITTKKAELDASLNAKISQTVRNTKPMMQELEAGFQEATDKALITGGQFRDDIQHLTELRQAYYEKGQARLKLADYTGTGGFGHGLYFDWRKDGTTPGKSEVPANMSDVFKAFVKFLYSDVMS